MTDCEKGPYRRVSRSKRKSSYSKDIGGRQDLEKQVKASEKCVPQYEQCGKSLVKQASVDPLQKTSEWFSNSFNSRGKCHTITVSSRVTRQMSKRMYKSGSSGEEPYQESSSTDDRKLLHTSTPKVKRSRSSSADAMDLLDNSDLFLAEMNIDTSNSEDKITPVSQNSQQHQPATPAAVSEVGQHISNYGIKKNMQHYNFAAEHSMMETQCTCSNVKGQQKPCKNRICTPFNFSYVDCDTQCQDCTLPASVSCCHDNSLLPKTLDNGSGGISQRGDTGPKTQLSSTGCEVSPYFNRHGHARNTGDVSITDTQYSMLTGKEPWSQDGFSPQTQSTDSGKVKNMCVYTSTQYNSKINDSNSDMFNDSFQDLDLMSQIDEIDSQISKTTSNTNKSLSGTLNMKSRSTGKRVSVRNSAVSLDDDLAEIEREMEHRRMVLSQEKMSASLDESTKSQKTNTSHSSVSKISKYTHATGSLVCTGDVRPETRTENASPCVSRSLNSNKPKTDGAFLPKKQETNSSLTSLSKPTVTNQQESNKKPDFQNINKQSSHTVEDQTTGNLTSESESEELATKHRLPSDSRTRPRIPQTEHPRETPVNPAAASSLQKNIKKRLMANAGQRTPQGPAHMVDQLRQQLLERIQTEVEEEDLKGQGQGQEIGPFYGLPSKVQRLFQSERGITQLYDWQEECLNLPAVLERRNLIYSLPTSGGKTLVAEILILRELLCRKKDAILVVPFVSIVQEKVRNLSQFAVQLDFLLEEYAGSKGRFPPIKRRKMNTLYIATIEKAHSIINSLIETERLGSVGLIVVDELHMLGEGGGRGSTLESTLMKVLYAGAGIQMVGMSATLNNIGDLKQFLNAEVYTNDFRPVELTEYVKCGDSIYSIDNKAKCPEDQFLHDRIVCFQYKPEMNKVDPDHLLGLVLEVIPDNSCLLFCPTKKNCENVAMMLSKLMVKYKRELCDVKKPARKALLKELYSDNEGKVCPVLQYTVHFGVAYHHSGLTMDERKLIEEAYSTGTLCLLTCTSTLAAGVNLPAKRVILRSPFVGQAFISRSQYKQMVGRAGRAGIDTSGESVLICKTADRQRVCELLAGPLESCHSSLMYDGGKGLRNLLLSSIGLKLTPTTEDVFRFVSASLVTVQQSQLKVDLSVVCQESLQQLVTMELVVQKRNQDKQETVYTLEVTELGRATFKGPVDPDYSGRLFQDLKKAEESLVLSSYLHLLYLVTPYDVVKDITPSWFIYFTQMNQLNAAEMKVASLVGVPEAYVARKASGQKSRLVVDEFAVNRFYLTLILYELWKQRTVWEVSEKFQLPRGFIQNLLSSAASFASCVLHFCQELEEFWAYQELLVNFVKRLSYCVQAELIPLMEVPGVKLGRAKMMYNAGLTTLSAVASVDPEVLVKKIEHMPRKVARQIVASAKLLLNEKADAMIEEVEEFVAIPEGFATAGSTDLVIPVLGTPVVSQGSVIGSQ